MSAKCTFMFKLQHLSHYPLHVIWVFHSLSILSSVPDQRNQSGGLSYLATATSFAALIPACTSDARKVVSATSDIPQANASFASAMP